MRKKQIQKIARQYWRAYKEQRRLWLWVRYLELIGKPKPDDTPF